MSWEITKNKLDEKFVLPTEGSLLWMKISEALIDVYKNDTKARQDADAMKQFKLDAAWYENITDEIINNMIKKIIATKRYTRKGNLTLRYDNVMSAFAHVLEEKNINLSKDQLQQLLHKEEFTWNIIKNNTTLWELIWYLNEVSVFWNLILHCDLYEVFDNFSIWHFSDLLVDAVNCDDKLIWNSRFDTLVSLIKKYKLENEYPFVLILHIKSLYTYDNVVDFYKECYPFDDTTMEKMIWREYRELYTELHWTRTYEEIVDKLIVLYTEVYQRKLIDNYKKIYIPYLQSWKALDTSITDSLDEWSNKLAPISNELFDTLKGTNKIISRDKALEHIADIYKIKNTIDEKLELLHISSKWLYTVWWKLHFSTAIPEEVIAAFKKKNNFSSTTFTMQHANSSMILPPVYSANELSLLCMIIENGWLIDEWTDLQIDIPGRLPNSLCGILGGSVLLSTDTSMEYEIDTFATNQDEHTGARFMTYDVYNTVDTDFKWLPKTINGRTSVLWRKSIMDIFIVQNIWSILWQTIHGWPFKDLWLQFINQYRQILKKYWLLYTLEEERVFDRIKLKSTAKQHHDLISLYNQERSFYQQSKQNTQITCLWWEVNELIQTTIDIIKQKQKKLK